MTLTILIQFGFLGLLALAIIAGIIYAAIKDELFRGMVTVTILLVVLAIGLAWSITGVCNYFYYRNMTNNGNIERSK